MTPAPQCPRQATDVRTNKLLVFVCSGLSDRLAGLLVSVLLCALLWVVGLPEATTQLQAASDPPAPGIPHLLPLLLSGVMLDVGRWRMRTRLNRARQAAFHRINSDWMEHEARLVQRLLALRRQSTQQQALPASAQRLLDGLIVTHHRHLCSLHRLASDSDLMAPLITGAYADELPQTTWSASLQREFEKRNHRR